MLDIDKPTNGLVEQIHERLGLSPSQALLMTSPSFSHTGNVHLALRLEYQESPPTHKLGLNVLRNLVGDLCEVYPQKRRKLRLPFGLYQHILSGEYQRPLKDATWVEGMHWLKKLDPLPIDDLLGRIFSTPVMPSAMPSSLPSNHSQSAALELLEHGLSEKHSRHESQWILAWFYFRHNWLPEDAIAAIQRWLRAKHNGMSQSVNQGRWPSLNAEIERQVTWIWHHAQSALLPDYEHNQRGFITPNDLHWIAQTFPGEVVNQKRLFQLVCYYRVHSQHEFVYIPARIWRSGIANDRTYHEFVNKLVEMNLLQPFKTYRHIPHNPAASFSRKFKLQLPALSGTQLQQDGRNVTDYYEALFMTGNSIQQLVELTGITRQRFYEAKKRLKR